MTESLSASHPSISSATDRRRRRSDDPITALHYQLSQTRGAARLEAVVLVDDTGCLVADIRMPGLSGLDLLAELNRQHLSIPTILITAHGDESLRLQAMRAGAVKFLSKPVDSAILLASVQAALEF